MDMKYKIGDKVRVVANIYVSSIDMPLHHYELGEIVRVERVTEHLIYCKNPKGLKQTLKPTYIEPLKKINKINKILKIKRRLKNYGNQGNHRKSKIFVLQHF